MDAVRHSAISHRLITLVKKFRNKEYRDSYVASHTRRFLAQQMRMFRGEKSQAEFGDLIGRRQTVVSRLEDPKYGKWTLQTLFDVASALNVAVIVRFVDMPTFLKYSEDMSNKALNPQPCDDEQLDSVLQEGPGKRIILRPSPADEPEPQTITFDDMSEVPITRATRDGKPPPIEHRTVQ